jgi:aminoglycoside phosphotransferase family enzyme/predicted kinase
MTNISADMQAETIAFLADPRQFGPVRRFDTHGAIVFVGQADVFKIKRAIKLPYMDFSTVKRRRRACEIEFDLNRHNAPDIYIGVVAITRDAEGTLAIDGTGVPVEWAVHMRRFEQEDMLSQIAKRGELDADVAKKLADAVYASHARAPIRAPSDEVQRLTSVINKVHDGLTRNCGVFVNTKPQTFAVMANASLNHARDCLTRRAAAGLVRRCHGDIHLANIVLWRAQPVLFDALEFDDALATIDTLYDLAFLLMDLEFCRRRASANRVLNRYLWLSQKVLDFEALSALPLFLGLRAAIRAMVKADRLQQVASGEAGALHKARAYLDASLAFLAPEPPRLIAVGGFSGTGKSTLAAALAPQINPAPGAVHLRSDLERKALFDVGETVRLAPTSYTPEASARVYNVLTSKARIALAAGHAVIVDAVFAEAHERKAMAAMAADLAVPFHALWLHAPRELLIARIAQRRNDASDATPDIVDKQIAHGSGEIDWAKIDADGNIAMTLTTARRALELD